MLFDDSNSPLPRVTRIWSESHLGNHSAVVIVDLAEAEVIAHHGGD
jgi:hypothetical protein